MHSPGSTVSSQKRRIGVLPEDVQVHSSSRPYQRKFAKTVAACVVSKVVEAEPTIRVILVACRLSSSVRQPNALPNLPVLDFWLSSLRNALNDDPFWGPDFLHHLESRAELLENGIRSLVQQCLELEELLGRASNPSKVANVAPVKAHRYTPAKLTALRNSKLADEGNNWMQKVVLGCWTTLLADAARARREASLSKGTLQGARARCLTS